MKKLGACTDQPRWKDKWGGDCDIYVAHGRCKDGAITSKQTKAQMASWGSPPPYEACCACGGGTRVAGAANTSTVVSWDVLGGSKDGCEALATPEYTYVWAPYTCADVQTKLACTQASECPPYNFFPECCVAPSAQALQYGVVLVQRHGTNTCTAVTVSPPLPACSTGGAGTTPCRCGHTSHDAQGVVCTAKQPVCTVTAYQTNGKPSSFVARCGSAKACSARDGQAGSSSYPCLCINDSSGVAAPTCQHGQYCSRTLGCVDAPVPTPCPQTSGACLCGGSVCLPHKHCDKTVVPSAGVPPAVIQRQIPGVCVNHLPCSDTTGIGLSNMYPCQCGSSTCAQGSDPYCFRGGATDKCLRKPRQSCGAATTHECPANTVRRSDRLCKSSECTAEDFAASAASCCDQPIGLFAAVRGYELQCSAGGCLLPQKQSGGGQQQSGGGQQQSEGGQQQSGTSPAPSPPPKCRTRAPQNDCWGVRSEDCHKYYDVTGGKQRGCRFDKNNDNKCDGFDTDENGKKGWFTVCTGTNGSGRRMLQAGDENGTGAAGDAHGCAVVTVDAKAQCEWLSPQLAAWHCNAWPDCNAFVCSTVTNRCYARASSSAELLNARATTTYAMHGGGSVTACGADECQCHVPEAPGTVSHPLTTTSHFMIDDIQCDGSTPASTGCTFESDFDNCDRSEGVPLVCCAKGKCGDTRKAQTLAQAVNAMVPTCMAEAGAGADSRSPSVPDAKI